MKQRFLVKLKNLKSEKEEVFNNHGKGFSLDLGVTYIELGDIPFTIRYTDYGKMFKGALTIIIQYTEQPANITVETIDGTLSKTLVLGGTPDCNDIGVFRIYPKK